MIRRAFFFFVGFLVLWVLVSFVFCVLAIAQWILHFSAPPVLLIIWIVVEGLSTLGIKLSAATFIVDNRESVKATGSIVFVVMLVSLILLFVGQIGVYSLIAFIAVCIVVPVDFYIVVMTSAEVKRANVKAATNIEKEVSVDQPTCSVCRKPSQYEVCMECERTYQKEIQRVRSQNWRAKKAGEPATLTLAQWLETLKTFNHLCAYCQSAPYQCIEHYIPIGQGKQNGGTTVLNCVPACLRCNTSKSNRHPENTISVNK